MAGSNTELIKEKLDIVQLLKDYLKLQPAGKNFKALCPFHREKTPSFMISPERQSWHCFGCASGGDIFSFVMRYENLEFSEALKMLAEKAGVELQRASPADYKYFGLLYELNDKAKDFFKKELEGSKPAQAYLTERGITPETIEEFEIGWAPNAPDDLNLHLINSGYASEDVLRAGLAFRSERGMQLDRFRGRIMFPIHNHFGKTVGFTGRILPQFDKGDAGKYVNSPETPIFNKSKLLYGYFASKNFIRTQNSVFLVEGQMDFLMSWQAGIKHAVASSGTALTDDHLRVLRRLTDQMTVSFDSDEAGLAAGERAIDLAEANDFNVKVALFEGFKDPAEAVQHDPAAFKKSVASAVPAPEFYFERYLKNFTSSRPHMARLSPDFKRNLRVVLAKIKNMASAVERSLWLKELGRRTGIEEKALLEESEALTSAGKETFPRKEAQDDGGSKKYFSRRELLSQHLLAVAAASNAFDHVDDALGDMSPEYRKIFEIWKSGERTSSDPNLDELMNLILLRSGLVEGEKIELVKKNLAEEHGKEERRRLTDDIKKAEALGDETAVRLALQKFNNQSQPEKIK